MSGSLVLEDGTVFAGEPVAADGKAFGEAVGDRGVAPGRSESARPHERTVLTCGARGPEWTDRLAGRGIVAVTGVDTRSLVLRLREGGSMRAVAVTGEAAAVQAIATARREEAVSLQESHEVAARAS